MSHDQNLARNAPLCAGRLSASVLGPVSGDPLGRSGAFLQRLVQVGDDVRYILDAHGQTIEADRGQDP